MSDKYTLIEQSINNVIALSFFVAELSFLEAIEMSVKV